MKYKLTMYVTIRLFLFSIYSLFFKEMAIFLLVHNIVKLGIISKYRIAERFADINYLSLCGFLYNASNLWVTKNPPKILTAARTIAKNPKTLEVLKILLESPAKPAIIAGLAEGSIIFKNVSFSDKPRFWPTSI